MTHAAEATLKPAGKDPGKLQGITLVLPVITIVMGSAILAPNFPLILTAFQQQVGAQSAEYLVNALLTIPALCIALFSPLAGILADRFGRRKLLINAMIAYGLVGVLPLLVADVWFILASRVGLGLCESIIMTCSTALLGDYFTGKRRDHWLAMQTTIASVSAMVMFPLGGFIGGHFGWNYPFAMYVVSFLLVLLVIAFTWEPTETQARRPKKSVAWSSLAVVYGLGLASTVLIASGLKLILPEFDWVQLYALGIALLFAISIPIMFLAGKAKNNADASMDPFPWVKLAGIMVVVAAASVMFYLLQIKLAQALAEMDLSQVFSPDLNPTLKGALIITITSLGIPLGTIAFTRISQMPINRLIALEFGVIAVGFFGMGWAPGALSMIIFSFINQFGCGLTLPTMLTWTMRQLSFHQRGQGAGIFSAYQNGGQFVGPQLLTFLAASFTAGAIKPAFSFIGWLALAVALGALLNILTAKRRSLT